MNCARPLGASVPSAANRNSPLVRQTIGTTFGLGVSYTWMRPIERVSD